MHWIQRRNISRNELCLECWSSFNPRSNNSMFSLEIFIRKQYSLLFSFSSCCCSNYFCLFSHDEMEPEVKFLKPYLRNPVIVFQECFWVQECHQNIKHKRRSSLSIWVLGWKWFKEVHHYDSQCAPPSAPLWFTRSWNLSKILKGF